MKVNFAFYMLLVLTVSICGKWWTSRSDVIVKPAATKWLTGYDMFSKSSFTISMIPSNHGEIAAALALAELDGATVTIRGGGLSFGGQALPPMNDSSGRMHYILDTGGLKEMECIHTAGQEEEEVVLRVGAGVRWEEAIRHANMACGLKRAQRTLPYSAPTSGSVTISGSVASHGHSRTTAATGMYTHEHISEFTLVTPRREYVCNLTDPVAINHSVCAAAVGSFGRIGVIDRLLVHFKVLEKHTRVESEVLFAANDLNAVIVHYLKQAVRNTHSRKYEFGVNGVFYGSRGEGYLVASRFVLCKQTSACTNDFPGFDGPTPFNKVAYIIGHMVGSRLRTFFFKNTFYNKRIGYSDPETSTFFQDVHGAARQLLSYIPVLSPLPITHQTWFIPGDNITVIVQFLQLVYETLRETAYVPLQDSLLVGDIMRVPASPIPTYPSYYHGPGHVFTVTFAVHDDLENKNAIQFCRDVSSRSYGPVVPMLLKGIYAPKSILRDAHTGMLAFVQRFAAVEDPSGILDSMLWRELSL